jgi:competence protein ComEC
VVFLVAEPLRRRSHAVALSAVAWLAVGLVAGATRPAPGDLRCTFLAVGHGSCVVLETPDGRTLVYDAGAMAGPEVTRRQIAPFLWHRGIRRIDELILSHADLDHFNGVPDLLERFAVGSVLLTPSFADRDSPGALYTLEALKRRKIPGRVVHAGNRLTAGEVTLDVLHPPPKGPDGPENVRSLVLLVRHEANRLLLTGDLEGAGLDRVLEGPPLPVDVFTS